MGLDHLRVRQHRPRRGLPAGRATDDAAAQLRDGVLGLVFVRRHQAPVDAAGLQIGAVVADDPQELVVRVVDRSGHVPVEDAEEIGLEEAAEARLAGGEGVEHRAQLEVSLQWRRRRLDGSALGPAQHREAIDRIADAVAQRRCGQRVPRQHVHDRWLARTNVPKLC